MGDAERGPLAMAKVTLNLAGRPLTFETGTRVEGCMPPHVSVPKPGPCPGGKRAKKGATAIAKAVIGGRKAIADTKAAKDAARKKLAKELALKLAKGEGFEADPDVVAEMFTSQINADSPPMNLAKMGINGPGYENMFNNPMRDIPRKEMPAMPPTVDKLIPLIHDLGAMGIDVELIEDVDPRTLRPVQTELSAPKVAFLADKMKDGWMKGGAIIVSEEDGIGDGHHRWAASALARMKYEQGVPGYKPMNVTVLKVKTPLDKLLPILQKHSGERKGLDEKPA